MDHHAGASSVDVRLVVAGQRLQVWITDDGEGFDADAGPEGAVDSDSFGLPGMAERAETVGGSVQVRSARGEGTTVVVSIPIEGGLALDGPRSFEEPVGRDELLLGAEALTPRSSPTA